MLQTIRSKTHGVVAWIVIIVIGFVFAIWGIEGFMSSGSNEVAKVNGQAISTQEFQRTYQQLARQQQLMQAIQGTPPVSESVLQQQALSGLVAEKMLSSAARKEGFAVGKDQVDDLLRALPQFQDESGQYAPEKFESTINNMGFTAVAFRQAVQNDLMIGQVRSSIVDSSFVLPYEFDRTLDLLEQKRDIQYVLISAAQYLPQVQVTPEQIAEFYEARPADFMLPERMSIQYVRLNADAIHIENPDDKTLQDFYTTHQASFTEPEKRHAAHILLTSEKISGDAAQVDALAAKLMQELQQGADFSALAKEYSADPGSSTQGGDLGWFGRGMMVPEFEEAVFTAKSDTLVGPIKTDFGLHIIKVIGVQPETVKPFDTVKEEVRTQWVADQKQTLFDEELAQLDTLAFENPEHLDTVAEQLKLSIEQSPLFTRDNAQSLGELGTPDVVHAAYSDAVLLENRNSELVYLAPTDVIVLRKLMHEAAQLQPLDAVHEQIKNHLASEQAAKLAHQQGDAWVAELKSGASADKLNIAWVVETKTSRYNNAVPPAVLNKAFALPVHDSAVIPVGKEDYALIMVNASYPGVLDPSFADQMRQEYMSGLQVFKGEMDYQLYVINTEKNSDIEVKM
ncbi:MAG: SurA N-terminal domain-containing protein [Legionellales bacterium]|jgi:peptidyl-prolyl cis-trans isomerase D